MSVKEKMDKLKRVLSGQDDDDEQNIATQASANTRERIGRVELRYMGRPN